MDRAKRNLVFYFCPSKQPGQIFFLFFGSSLARHVVGLSWVMLNLIFCTIFRLDQVFSSFGSKNKAVLSMIFITRCKFLPSSAYILVGLDQVGFFWMDRVRQSTIRYDQNEGFENACARDCESAHHRRDPRVTAGGPLVMFIFFLAQR